MEVGKIKAIEEYNVPLFDLGEQLRDTKLSIIECSTTSPAHTYRGMADDSHDVVSQETKEYFSHISCE